MQINQTTTKPDANKPDSGNGDAAVGTGGGASVIN